MCGIVGYTGVKFRPSSVVIDGLKRLEYRGYDSAGIALGYNDSLRIYKEVGNVDNLLASVESIENYDKSFAAIGHTRWATHGEVTRTNAHPHISDRVAIVHNGIIDNADELRKKLFSLGYEPVSDTDSEVLAHLIDSHLEDNAEEAVNLALREVHGTYGIAVLFKDFPGVIVAARNGSPLVIGIDNNGHYVASDANAISQYTNQFIYMEDGDIVSFNKLGMKMNTHRNIQTIELEDSWAALEGYKHFMLKEICEQPDSIRRCLGGRVRDNTCVLGGFDLKNKDLACITSVTIIACGTSYYAGMVARNIIEEYSRIPCTIEIASEFANKPILPDKNGIYLAVSQSGETYDTIESIMELHQKGAAVFGIVNVVGSSIARICGSGVYIHAGPEIAVASTKAFTGQIAALIMFAIMLGRTRYLSKNDSTQLCSELRNVPDMMEKYLNTLLYAPEIRKVAEDVTASNYTLFLGRGISYPVALEGALKLKEIAYVPCEAYAGGEMKHGPIAMIDNGTPVICINPDNKNSKKMYSNIQEVKARGAKIIAICPIKSETAEIADIVIDMPFNFNNKPFSPFFTILPLQLIAYYAALLKGNDVDKPRNLAKSVTVG